MTQTVNVIGAGLAGSEAAYQLAERGIKVNLIEMRPVKQTPAHHTDKFAELVCSNSLRGNALTNGVGVLKEEMRRLNSIIIEAADKARVPAGGALAVDRHDFSGYITETLKNHENITVINEEINAIPDGYTIIATGPLTTETLAQEIVDITGKDQLYFYDAAAPIIEKESIDMDKVYLKSRYDKGEAAYLNCPMTEDEFNRFYDAVLEAEVAPVNSFEKEKYELISQPNIQFAGQMTGVEGYVESAASGLVAGINLAHKILGKGEVVFPRETMIGSMAYYISHAKNNKNFQPMNANFGLLPSLETRIKDKKERYEAQANRALDYLENFKKTL